MAANYRACETCNLPIFYFSRELGWVHFREDGKPHPLNGTTRLVAAANRFTPHLAVPAGE